jgi:hypothetical protein
LADEALLREEPIAVVSAFGNACNAHELEAALSLCADDIVFDGTTPPDGLRVVGHDALRQVWMPIFADPATHMEVEDTFAVGDRVTQRCCYSWENGHVRAVDIYRVVDRKITEKLSYVKG